MTAETRQRIWFHPPKFWSLTQRMPKDEIDRLFDRVYRLAEVRDLEALKEFEFISVTDQQDTEPPWD